MRNRKYLVLIMLLLLLVPFGVVLADDDFEVTLTVDNVCEIVDLTIETDAGTGPISLSINYGDTDEPVHMDDVEFPLYLVHPYPGQGEYEISVKVTDSVGMQGEVEQEISIMGPEVTLDSDPFPPLLTLEGGGAGLKLIAILEGGTEPFEFEWDLDGDESPEALDPSSSTAEFTYIEAGEYKAKVKVTDGCLFSESDKLTVVVLDAEMTEDEEERDSEKTCHPMAEKIAQALLELSNKTESYDCEKIYAIFRGSLNGAATIGFGRLWHAYKMATVIDELKWEDILDWKLNGTSWGLLNQVNRFAETVDAIGISEMVELVLSGENSAGEIRTAMRMTLRYDAEFMDTLERISNGASKGELGQFYKLAQDLEMTPTELDIHLERGASLSEVRHASKLFDRTGATIDEILMAHGNGSGWGEINQAHRLADEGMNLAAILEIGVNEYRQQLREEGRLDKMTESDERMIERDERIAYQFGEKYGASPEDVMALYNGECEWKWACVRVILRDRTARMHPAKGMNAR